MNLPEYNYTDGVHDLTLRHPINFRVEILCPQCQRWFWRKYKPPRVNWNGLRPSQGEYSNTFKTFFATAPERRERFERRHEEHEEHNATTFPDRTT